MSRADPESFHVTIVPQGRTFTVRPEESILDAALNVGIHLPHSCKGGSCGSCRARILSGSIRYPYGPPLGINAGEIEQGYALLCEARPASNVSVDIREVRLADDIQIKDLPCRIVRKELLAPDVMALFLQLPAIESFHFLPGQYLDVMLPGERRRSFSIASPPHDSRPLELHVRRAPGGEFTQRVFADPHEKTLLRIEGPLGQYGYVHDPGTPAILVGGGTGFAPLKSIIRHVLEMGLLRSLHLFWGARTPIDLYEHERVLDWTRTYPNLRYTPVLSDLAADDPWTGRRGLVHESVFDEYDDLRAAEIYVSGPPALVEAIKAGALQRGLPRERLHFDSFEYAPDALAKMRQLRT